jgi:hypothetical protein
MPIDNSIYFQGNGSLASGFQQGMSIAEAAKKSQREDESYDKQKAEDDAWKNGVVTNPDGTTTIDRTKVLPELAKIGGKQYLAAQEKFNQNDAETQKSKIEKMKNDIDMAGRLLGGVKDQASWDMALNDGAKLGLDVSKHPRTFVPEYVNNLTYRTMSAKERIDEHYKQQELDIRRMEAGNKAEERAASRSDRKRKDAELSTVQAKQMGLYQSGQSAEEQYNNAVKDKNEYDPTSSGQWIDNSSWAPNALKNNKAIEAKAAKDAWIESYLRDASGAAIAPSERGAYSDIYFPAPGDTADVVKNKAALRSQKAQNSLLGAGPQGSQIANKNQAPRQEADVSKYAKEHGISYDDAQRIKTQRTSKQAGI